jgi:acyl-homoserine-lactone acylase
LKYQAENKKCKTLKSLAMQKLILLFITWSLFITPVSSMTSNIHEDIVIRRTEYGVPHIKASSLHDVALGLAWCEVEDYGEKVVSALLAARGDAALVEGYEAIESDFIRQQGYQRTIETYFLLDQDTRDMYEGFAAGVNLYLKTFPDEFPRYSSFSFTGYDVAAATVRITTYGSAWRFLNQLMEQKAREDSVMALSEDGSNAWAFAPERTKSGNAILLRNPHLSWDAGYYEAHLTVDGKLNFYGDFRIGGLFAIIGGFNDHLGWSTTNNYPDLNEIYAFDIDPDKPDHYLFDETSVPIQRKSITAEFKNGEGISLETREFLTTPLGPVIHRSDGKIYIIRQAGDGEYRRGQQFVQMMMSKNMEEWKDAMRMQAISSSNYTYADDQGNIYYVWNAAIPDLPHVSGGDTNSISVSGSSQVWTKVIPFDKLPQLLNPKGGYLHNENDPFHFTNLNEIIPPENYPDYFPEPRLRQRSQHSLQLIHNDQKFSLEDVVELKHSMKMIVAEQVKDDLLRIARNSESGDEIKDAIEQLEKWDNSVASDSKGGVLFECWFREYVNEVGQAELFAKPWSYNDPMNTPKGISDTAKALSALIKAVALTKEKYGTLDLTWGEVHRLRHGDLDLPVGGGPSGLGCFRVLGFREADDGKQEIQRGDGWVFAVEFSNPPRAYSILAYGQSAKEESPHHTDQAELFANNKMKKVAFTEKEIRKSMIREYRPGEVQIP